MSTIPQTETKNHQTEKIIRDFFGKVKIGSLLRESNIRKDRGVSALALFQYLFALVLMPQSHYQNMSSRVNKPFAKDAVYRYLNEGRFHWEKFLLRLAEKVISLIVALDDPCRKMSLIVDDTIFERSRSKAVELIGKVFDHSDGLFKRGFYMLTVAWSDGSSVVPCMFRMVAAAKKHLYCPAQTGMDRRTIAARRREKAQQTKPEMVLEMLTQIADRGILAQHVLMDSWFALPELLAQVHALGFAPLVMLKRMNWRCYRYKAPSWAQPRHLTLQELYFATRQGQREPIYAVHVSLKSPLGYTAVKITFTMPNSILSKNKRAKDWAALLTTDLTLSAQEMVRLYGRRWGIETMFQECKEDLLLAKEFYTQSLDATIASATIVLTRYICLAFSRRYDVDPRAWGDLFMACCEELADLSYQEALHLLILSLTDSLSLLLGIDKHFLQVSISSVFSSSAPFSISPFPNFLPTIS